jgi:hypothetical protein
MSLGSSPPPSTGQLDRGKGRGVDDLIMLFANLKMHVTVHFQGGSFVSSQNSFVSSQNKGGNTCCGLCLHTTHYDSAGDDRSVDDAAEEADTAPKEGTAAQLLLMHSLIEREHQQDCWQCITSCWEVLVRWAEYKIIACYDTAHAFPQRRSQRVKSSARAQLRICLQNRWISSLSGTRWQPCVHHLGLFSIVAILCEKG